MTVTCETVGCGNSGAPIEIPDVWPDLDGELYPVEVVGCGVCGGWIIAPAEPEPEPEPDEQTALEQPEGGLSWVV